MKRTYVMSTDLKSVGYDETAQILEIEFLNSAIVQYKNVSKIAHLALMTAQAKGLHFNTYIKNEFASERIADGIE
jgi:hypothetical protein